MPTLHGRIPKYSYHKASGQDAVSLAGHDVYLGTHGSPESKIQDSSTTD